MTPRPEILFFDVNETLLDMSALRPSLGEALGSDELMGEWFARTLHGSLVANAIGRHRDFGDIAASQLVVVARRHGRELTSQRVAEIVSGMRRLPPHPDVTPGLAALREGGFRLATLTNGSTDALADQLRSAGLTGFFERTISVDAVQRFKPAPEVYLHAAAVAGVDVDRALLVAAHDWDVAGAMSVGMAAAFVERPGSVWGLAQEPPSLVVPDLERLADRLTPRRA